MNAKELAALLDGREYMHEITKEEEALAKASDLLVVFGRSDDLCELRGAIDDELGCYEAGELTHPDLPAPVTAVWCPDDLFSWGYETTLPHATFRIHEDGEPYCIGIVIDLTLARAELYWCEQCCNFDREHAGVDGYAPCRFTGILTYSQTYGKDCRGFNRPAESFAEVRHGTNDTENHPVDEFICSECGLIMRDCCRYEIDKDDGDEICYEFAFRYCPRCGIKINDKGSEP